MPLGLATVSWRRLAVSGELELNMTVPFHAVANVHFPLLGQVGATLGGCQMLCQHGAMVVASSTSACSSSGVLHSATCSTRPDGEEVLVIELPPGRFTLQSVNRGEIL